MADNYDQLALKWVREEVNKTLDQARQSLEAFAENPEDYTPIGFCVSCLHQVRGTLQMLEFFGAALFAEEMEALADAVSQGRVKQAPRAMEILMGAILQLPTYLERVQAGQKDLPVLLLPLLNDLRAARGETLLSESAIFSPNLVGVIVPHQSAAPDQPHSDEEWKEAAKKLRHHFQRGLLGILRQQDVPDSVQRVSKVLERVSSWTQKKPQAQLWWVASAFADAIAEGEVWRNASVHALLGQLDKVLKHLGDHGTAVVDEDPPIDLLKNLLYYVACSNSEQPLVQAVQVAYYLKEALPSADQLEAERRRMGGSDAAAMRTVLQALQDDLAGVKDGLDLFVRTKTRQPQDLLGLMPTLRQIADTLGLLGLGVPRDAIRQQVHVLQRLAESGDAASDAHVMDIAGALLFVEANLSSVAQNAAAMAAEEADDTAPVPQTEEDIAAEAQYDDARVVLLNECRGNLQKCKDSIIDFMANSWDHRLLDGVPGQLLEVQGGMQIIGLPEAAELVGLCARYLSQRVVGAQTVPNANALDALADVLTSVEYFLESLQDAGGQGLESVLGAASDSAAVLAHDLAQTPEDLVQATAEAVAGAPLPTSEPVVVAAATPARAPTPVFTAHDDLIDQEVIEIFIEEAGEQLATINDLLPGWIDNPDDREALITVRRAFHTLKGSGRLVGAAELGETAWAMETMLNRVLDASVPLTRALQNLVREAAETVFPALRTAFAEQKPSTVSPASLVARAEALGRGEAIDSFAASPMVAALAAVTPEAVEAVAVQPVAVEPVTELAAEPVSVSEAETPLDEMAAADAAPETFVETVAESVADVAAVDVAAEAAAEDLPTEEPELSLNDVFAGEAGSHLDAIALWLDEVASSPFSPRVSDDLIRALHTLKGSARMAGIDAIGDVMLPLEKQVRELQNRDAPVDADTRELLTAVLQATRTAVAALDAGQPLDADALHTLAQRADAVHAALPAVETQSEQRDPELVALFLNEAMDLLAEADLGLRTWQVDPADSLPPAALADTLFTLAQAADTARLAPVAELSRALAALYDRGAAAPNEGLFALGQTGQDQLLDMLDCIAADQNVAVPAALLQAFTDWQGSVLPVEQVSVEELPPALLAEDFALPVDAGLALDDAPVADAIGPSEAGDLGDASAPLALAPDVAVLPTDEEPVSLLAEPALSDESFTLTEQPFLANQPLETEAVAAWSASDDLGALQATAEFDTQPEAQPETQPGSQAEASAFEIVVTDAASDSSDWQLADERLSLPEMAMQAVDGSTSLTASAADAADFGDAEFDAVIAEALSGTHVASDVGTEAVSLVEPDAQDPTAELHDLLLVDDAFINWYQELLNALPAWQAPEPVATEAVAEPQPRAPDPFDDVLAELAAAEAVADLAPEFGSEFVSEAEPEALPPAADFEVSFEDAPLAVLDEPLAQDLVEESGEELGEELVAEPVEAAFEEPVPEALVPEALVLEASVPIAEAAPALVAPPAAEPFVASETMLPGQALAMHDEGDRPVAITPDADAEEIMEVFLEEADDILDSLDETLGNWAQNPGDRGVIALLQRQLHTLKGGARLSDLNVVGDLSHELENLFEGINDGHIASSPVFQRVAQEGRDRLAALIKEVRGQRTQTRPGAYWRRLKLALTGADPYAEGAALAPVAAVIETPETEAASAPTALAQVPEPVEPVRPAAKMVPFQRNIAAEEMVQAAGEAQRSATAEYVRVGAGALEDLVNLVGETSIFRSRLEQQVTVLRGNLVEMEQTVARLREQLRSLEIENEAQIAHRREILADESDFDPLEFDRYTRQQELTRSLSESTGDLLNLKDALDNLAADSETLLLQQGRVNSELQDGLMRTRMVPFSSVVPRLKRMVRQIGEELGKGVEINIVADGEMDRTVLERMVAPLEHMLRNAIDHGIERPELRKAAGKGATGKIKIRLMREGNEVVIEIADDGAGINVDAVQRKALERGLITEQSQLTEHELMLLIFEPGFSTAEKVTQISGRGVGMDVVASEIKALGGRIDIDSHAGAGSRFTVRLPFTVSVNQALMVQVGDDVYAIPLANIEGIVRVSPYELQTYYQDEAVKYEYAGQPYRMRYLGKLLDHQKDARLEGVFKPVPVLLLHGTDQPVALQVDELLGSREIVVKSVGSMLSYISGLSGATILGDGRVVLILDLPALLRRADAVLSWEAEAVVDASEQPLVMVVDDSITVRKVTARLLERHNYRVLTAKDGIDAVNILHDTVPDIMLLDIEMPRMDGFELANIVRHDERLAELPIVMITSRTGDKHRARAAEIGVNRYLGKPFNDVELLGAIEQLLSARGVTS